MHLPKLCWLKKYSKSGYNMRATSVLPRIKFNASDQAAKSGGALITPHTHPVTRLILDEWNNAFFGDSFASTFSSISTFRINSNACRKTDCQHEDVNMQAPLWSLYEQTRDGQYIWTASFLYSVHNQWYGWDSNQREKIQCVWRLILAKTGLSSAYICDETKTQLKQHQNNSKTILKQF